MNATKKITMVVAFSAAIGSFAWMPPVIGEVRTWLNEPAITAIKGQTKIMAAMKKYDIRTDDQAADQLEIKESIRGLQVELATTPNISPAHQKSLQRLIESYKKKLSEMDDMLSLSKAIDQRILSELTGAAF